MLRNPSWGVLGVVVCVLLPATLLATGCGDHDALPGVNPPPAPQNKATAAKGLVSGGTVMRSSQYHLIGSMAPGVADGTVGRSPTAALRTGLIGASQ